MSGFPIRDVRRRCLGPFARAAFVGVVSVAAFACSGGSAEQAADTEIGVETSQLFVTVENKVGAPLVNVTVAIQAAGGQSFSRLLPRLENGEKRDISLSDFSGRDGTSFNLRVVTPKKVRVSAEDVASKKHDIEVSWK
jgi:hypothetical protein